MNCTSATRQAAAQHILLATLDCSDDWKTGLCPVASMLELVQAGARILLIAAAGLALALAGIVVVRYMWSNPATYNRNDHSYQSVLAYMRELCACMARRKEGAGHEQRVVLPPHHPRDRDRTSPLRKSRPRRSLGKEPALTPIPASPVASTSKPTSIATPPGSPERSRIRQERSISRKRCSPRKQLRLAALPDSTASSETAVDLDRTPRPPSSGIQVVQEPQPPMHVYSDSSPPASTDPSVASISSGEQVESSRSVLQRIRSHHNNCKIPFLPSRFILNLTMLAAVVRDRCLIRVQSIPTPRPPRAPRRRTDPYQAPFYFPTPMSPDAGTYLQEVINERHGRLPASPNAVEQVRFASLPSSPNRETHDLPEPSPALSVPASVPPEGEVEDTSRPTARRHRWSWHMPHFPERTRSVDSDRNAHEKEHKDGFPKFKFGHSRRYVHVSSLI